MLVYRRLLIIALTWQISCVVTTRDTTFQQLTEINIEINILYRGLRHCSDVTINLLTHNNLQCRVSPVQTAFFF